MNTDLLEFPEYDLDFATIDKREPSAADQQAVINAALRRLEEADAWPLLAHGRIL